MSDDYGAYRDHLNQLQIKQKTNGLCECYTQALRAYGERVMQIIDLLMQAVYHVREGPDKGTCSKRAANQPLLNELYSLAHK